MQYTQRLEDLRKDRDLTQEQVAKLLNLKREQYRRYETGINEIKAGFIIKVCKLYNVSADYLLCFTNEYKPLPKNSHFLFPTLFAPLKTRKCTKNHLLGAAKTLPLSFYKIFLRAPREFYGVPADYILGLKMGLKYSK